MLLPDQAAASDQSRRDLRAWPTGLEPATFGVTIRSSVVRRGSSRYRIPLNKAILLGPATFHSSPSPSGVASITVKITVSDCGISLGKDRRAPLTSDIAMEESRRVAQCPFEATWSHLRPIVAITCPYCVAPRAGQAELPRALSRRSSKNACRLSSSGLGGTAFPTQI